MSTSKSEACCTCANLLSTIPPQYDEKTEKPLAQDRRLDCCGRMICGNCIARVKDEFSICHLLCALLTNTAPGVTTDRASGPFCQTSSAPSSLHSELLDPPAYSPPSSPRHSPSLREEPPPYTTVSPMHEVLEKVPNDLPAEDVLHFLDRAQDTIHSLSLRYGVPPGALRNKNRLWADHLLAARKTVLIPGEYYKGGVSLSPKPLESEEEEIRKGKVRRWMVACKNADYDIALLYLGQADYDVDVAVEAYLSDERWEKEHPMEANVKGKRKDETPRRRRFGLSNGITGQLS